FFFFFSSYCDYLDLHSFPTRRSSDLFLQVAVRGVIVFIATLIMVRLGSKRSLAEKTAFDAVLIVIIGSMLARAINGSEAFLPTRSEEHTSELQSRFDLVCRLLLEKKN